MSFGDKHLFLCAIKGSWLGPEKARFLENGTPAEISIRANEYLRQHPELYREALVRAQLMGCFEKPKRRRRSVS
jgi:hypothetical protein